MSSYEFWQSALAGNPLPVHDSDPQPGFYRKRTSKAGPFVPVAIWDDSSKMIALVDGKQADAEAVWSYVCQHPITEAQYHKRVETGKWHDEDEAVTQSLTPPRIGDNNPPTDEAEILKGQIEAASAGVSDYAEINDDATAAKAQSLRSRLLELSGDAEKAHKTEKAIPLEEGRRIDKRWFPLRDAATAGANAIRAALSAHETRKDKALKEAAAKVEAERQKLLKEQLAKHPEAPIPQEIVAPAPPPQAPSKIAGAYGRAASVKVVKIATVEDYDEATTYFRNNADYRAVIDKLAQKAVNDGLTVPGVKITEERKVT